MKLHIALAAMTLSMCSSAIAAAPAMPAGDGDTRKVIELTRHLEEQPLAEDGKAARAWLIGWITQAPELQINLCDTLQVLKKDQEYEHTAHLVVQTMFGMAAWELEHPQARGMDLEVQLAGVRSALRAYASILRDHPQMKFAPMDRLAAHEAAGDLPAHMKGVVASECKP
jgi:hypothetical protein